MHWVFDYPWGPTLTWLAAIGALMVLVASFGIVWRELWPISVVSVLLALLRIGSFGLLLFLLFQPNVILKRSEEIKPYVAVLLDTSGSMGLTDSGAQKSRLRQATDSIQESQILEVLDKKAKLGVFEFATSLSRLKADGLATMEKATGTGTSLGLALAQVREEFQGQDLAGVILFSDGRDNTGIEPLAAAKALEAPLWTVGFGRPKPKEEKEKERDLAIVSVSHDKRVVVGHVTDVTITVASKGFGARTVPVELVLDKEVIVQSSVALSEDRPERSVTIKLKPNAPGSYVYTVRVPPDPAEANKANNEKPIPILVTDPVARVLYVEARPRWEFKFISRVLAAYKNVEHTAVVRMAPGKMSIQGTNLAESKQIATMTPVQLQRLKGIIIGDVPRTFFSHEQLATIAALVEQGGSVLLLAGRDSFGPEGFANTPLAVVLPVQLLAQPAYMERRFRVELTPEGKAHEAFQNVNHEWGKAPELISLMAVGEPRPGATVLMKTTDGQDLPVAIVHRYGKGKAGIVLSDSTWRWKLGMAERTTKDDLSTIFWRQITTWMMPEQQAEKERRAVQLVADKLQYELTEPVTLTVTATDAEGKAVRDARAVCHVYAPDGKVIERQASRAKVGPAGEGQAEGYIASFVPHVSGKYKIVATAEAQGTDLGRDEITLLVGDTSVEMTETDPNKDLLKKLANVAGGSYYESDRVKGILDELVIKTKEHNWTEKKEVWDKWWALIAFFTLLSAEWILRRTRRLE
jgi:hypothetical protein